MTSERWQRVKDVVSLALKSKGSARSAVIDGACGEDRELRTEVEAMLRSNDDMGSFLEVPILGELPDPSDSIDDAVPSDLKSWTRYEIEKRLGSGGMAVVYKAWDRQLNRHVAIKVIAGRDGTAIKRFLREAQAQAHVDHEHVLRIYETGSVGDYHYIAMQYVDGPTLLGVRGETTLDAKVELILKIAEGLHAAHRQGLVHRDIKPSNILVERGADALKPYLLDFGLAVEIGAPSLTQTGTVLGTPHYMAPERIHGGIGALDRRSDIYSLGATFYEFIAGAPPFGSTSGLQVLVDVLEAELTPLRRKVPSLPAELDALVSKCLEKDPSQRYASARAMADDLRRYLNGDPVSARPTGLVARVWRKARKHPRLAAMSVMLLATTIGVAAWGGWAYWRASAQAALAQQFGQETRDLEWLYRAAQMSPLHAIAPERQQVRERIARVAKTISDGGSIAVGPGEYALGRGFLTLGDAPSALGHLDRAWQSGYRTADTAMALGLAHGEILRVETAKAQRIAADAARAEQLRQLERQHRDPALFFLAAGQSSALVPIPYVQALIASHRGDRVVAIAAAADAARQTPWLFEARLLPGHLEFQEAVRLYLGGDMSGGAKHASAADGHYADAERVAESALDAYLGRCGIAGLLLHMIQHGLTANARATFESGETSCTRALLVDPQSADAHRLYGDAVRIWGGIRVQNKEDPADAYDRATALVERAIALSPSDLESILTLADTYLERAWWESRRGDDPRGSITHAVAVYERAIAIDPRNLSASNNMSQALHLQGRFESRQGLDASGAYDRAVVAVQRGLRVDSSLASAYRVLSRVALERADEHARRGVDPRAGLEEVLRFIEDLPAGSSPSSRHEAITALRTRLEGRE